MDFSFVIATNRDPNTFVHRAINSIHANARHCPYSYEIIVVSPHKIQGDKVGLIKDTIEDGSVSAMNIGARNTSGKYIAAFPDNWLFQFEWWRIVDVIKGLVDRKYKIACWVVDRFGDITYPQVMCMHRDTMNDLLKGNLFNPCHHGNYSPNDLGFRLHSLAEPITPMPGTSFSYIKYQLDPSVLYLKERWACVDHAVFVRHWGHLLSSDVLKTLEVPQRYLDLWGPGELDRAVEEQLKKSLW